MTALTTLAPLPWPLIAVKMWPFSVSHTDPDARRRLTLCIPSVLSAQPTYVLIAAKIRAGPDGNVSVVWHTGHSEARVGMRVSLLTSSVLLGTVEDTSAFALPAVHRQTEEHRWRL